MKEPLEYCAIEDSALGPLQFVFTQKGLKEISIGLDKTDLLKSNKKPNAKQQKTLKQIQQYLIGKISKLELDLDVQGLTAFQEKVLRKSQRIPYGCTWSYGELAKAVGKPGGAQAIGQVMKRNPLPIIFPCHRVVASGGRLGGFNCGVHYKQILLSIENPDHPWQEAQN